MYQSYRNQSVNFMCRSIDYGFYIMGAFGINGSIWKKWTKGEIFSKHIT